MGTILSRWLSSGHPRTLLISIFAIFAQNAHIWMNEWMNMNAFQDQGFTLFWGRGVGSLILSAHGQLLECMASWSEPLNWAKVMSLHHTDSTDMWPSHHDILRQCCSSRQIHVSLWKVWSLNNKMHIEMFEKKAGDTGHRNCKVITFVYSKHGGNCFQKLGLDLKKYT